jgi:hypothetical protein
MIPAGVGWANGQFSFPVFSFFSQKPETFSAFRAFK